MLTAHHRGGSGSGGPGNACHTSSSTAGSHSATVHGSSGCRGATDARSGGRKAAAAHRKRAGRRQQRRGAGQPGGDRTGHRAHGEAVHGAVAGYAAAPQVCSSTRSSPSSSSLPEIGTHAACAFQTNPIGCVHTSQLVYIQRGEAPPDSPLPAGLASGAGIDALSTKQLMEQLGPFLGSGITTVTQRYERAFLLGTMWLWLCTAFSRT